MDNTLIGGLTIALLISLQYLRIVIQKNAKETENYMKEIRRRDNLLTKLDAKVSKLIIAVKHYRRLAEKEAEFNQRLLGLLTKPQTPATISETKTTKDNAHETNSHKPQQS